MIYYKSLYYIIFVVFYSTRYVYAFCNNGDYDCEFESPVTIGGYMFNRIGKKHFLVGNIDIVPKDSFPFALTNPTFEFIIDYLKYTNNQECIRKKSEEVFGDIYDPIPQFENIFYMHEHGKELCTEENKKFQTFQYIFTNKKQSILYAKFNEDANVKSFEFNQLGKSFSYKDLLKLTKDKESILYDITNPALRKIGCISNILEDSVLELSQYKFTTYGRENFWIRGICTKEDMILSFERIDATSSSIKYNIKLNDYKNKTKTYSANFPIVWETGLYKITAMLSSNKFITNKIEIYTPRKFQMKIKNKNQLDRFEEIISEVILEVDLKSIQTKSNEEIQFTIISIFNNKHVVDNELKLKCLTLSECKIKTDNINILVDPTKQMAFFSYNNENISAYTEMIDLFWLARTQNSSKSAEIFNGIYCSDYLKQNQRRSAFYCPVSLEMIMSIRSRYNKITKSQEENIQCFEEIVFKNFEFGRTCCYNLSSSRLITGAANSQTPIINDQYHKQASYQWKYPPSQPYQHFIYDRVPIIMCCFNSSYNCFEYWTKYQNVNINIETNDISGYLFGDPHFIGFSSHIQYSYYKTYKTGFFELLQLKSFNLFGIFRSLNINKKYQPSFLQYIYMKIKSNQLEVLPIKNTLNIPWIVRIRSDNSDFTIESFPFETDDMKFILSENQNELSIFVKLEKESFITMILKRYDILDNPIVYMNLKICINVPKTYSETIDGLFGRMTPNSQKFDVYEKYSAMPTTEFTNQTIVNKMVESWAAKWSDINSKLVKIGEAENVDLNFVTGEPKQECNKNLFCEVDYSNFKSTGIYKQTIEQYNDWVDYNNMLNKSLNIPEICPFPIIDDCKFNSTNVDVGNVIKVIGCLNPMKKLNTSNVVVLNCVKFVNKTELPKWQFLEGNVDKICIKQFTTTITTTTITDRTTTSSSPIIMYAIGGVIGGVILIIVLLVIVAFVVLKKYRNPKVDNAEKSAKVEMDTYDEFDSEYASYTSVKKISKNGNV